MVRLSRGLDPSIFENIDIQPYWTFEDVCKLAIKLEKHSKNKSVFGSSYTMSTVPPKPYSTIKPDNTSKLDGH